VATVSLELHDLTVGYASRPGVVQDASMRLKEGQTVAIVGPSGCGKTTLLKSIVGLLPPAAGSLEVLGAAWPRRAPRGQVGYIPQRLGLLRHATAHHNAMLGGLHALSPWRTLLGLPPHELSARADQALATVGLEDHAMDSVKNLSGGQQRRVAVARALVQRPALLAADEFLGELDPDTARVVTSAVKQLQRESAMAVIMVEHDIDQALAIADEVYLLRDRRLRHWETGDPIALERAVPGGS
jgi:ABC-type Mn2+/Zn2+ transport system ATPase subunit